MKNKEGTKLCKYCKTEISAAAKICPNCHKKQGMSGCLIVVIVFIVLVIIGAMAGGNSKEENKTINQDNQQVENIQKEEQDVNKEVEEIKIEYTKYTVTQMLNDLNENAMKASNTYKDQYLEITGELAVIDSDGKYISLYPDDGGIYFVGVQCSIKTDEQRQAVAEMSKGDIVTLRGKCTSVGEVLGYSLDIDSIGDVTE